VSASVSSTDADAMIVIAVAGEARCARSPARVAPTACIVSMPALCSPVPGARVIGDELEQPFLQQQGGAPAERGHRDRGGGELQWQRRREQQVRRSEEQPQRLDETSAGTAPG